MHEITQLIIYCIAILAVSLLGGWLPIWVKLSHKRLEIATSFVAGMMLGMGLLHMLPHAIEQSSHDIYNIMIWTLIGLLTMFFIERFFSFHHHDSYDTEVDCCGHEHDHHKPDTIHQRNQHHITWSGAAIGLTLHSVLAGIALAAGVQNNDGVSFAGIGIFIVILLHKPFDSMTIAMLMSVGKHSKNRIHFVNALFALAIPLGAVLFHFGLANFTESDFIAKALAFSAGTFLCVSLSDLLPELQFHHHDRIKLTLSLLAGLGFAWVIGLAEHQTHDHGHQHPSHSETINVIDDSSTIHDHDSHDDHQH